MRLSDTHNTVLHSLNKNQSLRYIGASVSLIALIMGTSLSARAETITYGTAPNGNVTLDLTAQSGETLNIDTSHPEFTKDKIASVNELTVNGGGTIIVGDGSPEVNTNLPDFSADNLKSININEGTLTINHPDDNQNGVSQPSSIIEGNTNVANLTIGKNGTLDLTHDTNDSNDDGKINSGTDIYSNVANLTGKGKILLGKYGSFMVSGDKSVFAGQIIGSGDYDMSTLPSYTAPFDESYGMSEGRTNFTEFNGKFSDFQGATIEKLPWLDFAGTDYTLGSQQAQASHTSIRMGTQINVGEVLIANGGSHESHMASVIISDSGTNVNTSQLIIGQQSGDIPLKLSDDGKTLSQPVRPAYDDDSDVGHGRADGTAWVSNGATVTIAEGGIHTGLYIGNHAGFGYDERGADASRNHLDEADIDGDSVGTLHITGDNVSYDDKGNINQTDGNNGGTVNVDKGTLWIGPINLMDTTAGSGSGLITVDHGGQLNLNDSFIVLGGENGTGNIEVNKGGTLNVTGTHPSGISDDNTSRTFSQTRQGAVTVNDGGVLNIGNSSEAGVLKVYGDLNLAQGGTTNFYEGTTTDKGNKGDAYNSYADVHGNLTLGGNISINAIAGQNKGQKGAVDLGSYHLFDYTGTLAAAKDKTFTATQAGQTGTYVYDMADKSVNVIVSNATDSNTTQDKPGAGAGSDNNANTGTSAGSGSDNSANTGTNAGSGSDNSANAGTSAGSGSDNSANTGTNAGSGSDNSANTGTNAGSGSDNSANAGASAGSGADNSGNAGTSAGSGSDNSANTGANAGSGSNNSTNAGANAGSGSDNSANTGANAGSGSNNSANAGANAGSGSNNSANAGANAGSGSNNSANTGANTGSGSDNSVNAGTSAGSGSDNVTNTGTNTGSGSDNSANAGTSAGSGSDNSANAGASAGSGSDNSANTGANAGSGSDNSANAGSGSDNNANTGASTGSGSNNSANAGASAGSGSDNSANAGTSTGSGSDNSANTGANTGSGSDNSANTGANTGSGSDNSANTGANAGSGADNNGNTAGSGNGTDNGTITPPAPSPAPTHVISGGNYQIDHSAGQPDVTSSLHFSSDADGYQTVSEGTITAPVSASGSGQNTLEINNNDGQTIAAINASITDNGNNAVGIQKTGTSTVSLNGQNSYTGVTDVVDGTLDISKTGDISSSSKTEVTSKGTLNVSGKTGKIVNNGTVTVSGQTGDISNSLGTTVVNGNGQVASMTNNGHAIFDDSAKLTGTLSQQSGQLELNGTTTVNTLATSEDQGLDHLAGLNRKDSLTSQSRKDFVAQQLKNATDPAAKGLLQAVSDSINGKTDTVLDDLKATNNLFTVGDKANVTINNLTGYGTGYLGDQSTLTLAGDHTAYGDGLFGKGKLNITGKNAVLQGSNYYSGGTEVATGASVTAESHSFGTGAVALDDKSTLNVIENSASSFDNTLNGTGTFNKTGSGTLTLNKEVDDSGFAGQTNVQSGLLTVNNTLGGTTNVLKGAALSGTGTLSSLNMASGSVLGVTLDGAGKNGPTISGIHVSGDAAINDATMAVSVQHLTSLALNKDYVTQALDFKTTGTGFSQTAFDTIFVKGKAEKGDNGLWNLDYRRYASYGTWARTANERAMANALTQADQKGVTTSFMGSLENLAAGNDAGAQARRAYNALSGEINADAKTAMVNDSFMIQEAVINRLDCAGDLLRARALDGKQQSKGYCDVDPNKPVTVWGTIYGQQGRNAGTSNAGALGQSSIGWIMGADTLVQGHWRVGGMLSYGRDWFDAKGGSGSSAHSNSATVGAYIGNAWRVGGLMPDAAITFKGGVSYSWNMINTNRKISYGAYSSHASSRNRAGTGQVFAETGYRMAFNEGTALPLEVEPFVRMTYVNYGQDSFREHGSDAALRVKGQNSSMGFSTMGIKVATSLSIGKILFSPHIEAAYRRAFGRTDAHVRQGFVATNNGYDMTIWGTGLSVDTAQINTGFGMRLTDRLDVNVDYIGQYGSSQTTTGGSGSIHYRF